MFYMVLSLARSSRTSGLVWFYFQEGLLIYMLFDAFKFGTK